jgi:hypothetical protein
MREARVPIIKGGSKRLQEGTNFAVLGLSALKVGA